MGVPSKRQTEPQTMPRSAMPRTADRNLRGFLSSNHGHARREARADQAHPSALGAESAAGDAWQGARPR